MADDFVDKSVKKQLFGEKEGRRSSNSPLRGSERRLAQPRREGVGRREGGRRLADDIADIDRRGAARPGALERRATERRTPDKFSDRRSGYAGRRESDIGSFAKQTDRDLRTVGGAATTAERNTVVTAPARTPRPDLLPKREWAKATEALPRASKIAKAEGILSKAGRWGKLGALALGAGYAAYKTLGGDK